MLKKQYNDDGTKCKVTFVLPSEIKAFTAQVLGEFNRWDRHATPMQKNAEGGWEQEITLDAGHEYQFRYLVNHTEWHNDWHADKYACHPLNAGENSVVCT